MRTTPDTDDTPTPRTASGWLVALNEEPDDPWLQARFEAWLAASPAHARDWAEMTRTAAAIDRTQPTHAAAWGAYGARRDVAAPPPGMEASGTATGRVMPPPTPEHRAGAPGRTGFLHSRRFAVAAAAMAACLAIIFGPNLVLRLQADHVTSTAQIQAVRLADGSTVRLGPESAIEVAFAAGERRVRLLKGEAFFDVAPDANRPFRVDAGRVETTVLGTAFDVRLRDDGTVVAVRHGLVRVDYDGVVPPVSERLEAGDWVRVGRPGPVARGSLPPDQVAAWLQGQLIVKDRPVGEVVDDLRRYFSGVVILRGESLSRQPLTGVYNLADPEAALRAVAHGQGASVQRLSPWVLIISGP